MGMVVHIRKVGCVCVCVCVFILFDYIRLFFCNLHIKALLKTFIVWFHYNAMDVINVVVFYLVIISDATNAFLHRDDQDPLNYSELTYALASSNADLTWHLTG